VEWVWGVVGSLILVAGLVAVLYFSRMRSITSRVGSFECHLRAADSPRWYEGYACYGADRLDWFPVASLVLRPRFSWQRGEIEILRTGSRTSRHTQRELVDATVSGGGRVFHLVVMREAYSGLRSWLESAPPTPASFQ